LPILVYEITIQKLIVQKTIFQKIPSQKVTFLSLLTEIIVIAPNIVSIDLGPGIMIKLGTPPSIITPDQKINDFVAVPAIRIPVPLTPLLPEVHHLPVLRVTTALNLISLSK
jgi:hypothetical protein